MARPPLLVFAYANDRVDDRRYLRNLPEERRRVKEALRAVSDAGRCKIVECANATVEEVLDECQRGVNELAILHFAGHADGKTLLFEKPDGGAQAAGAASIAEFLGGLASLKLVVLNGCSTRDQVDTLLARGVPVVVATSVDVRDEVATDFAGRFYRALAGSATIAAAFSQASGAVKARSAAPSESAAIRAITRDVAPRANGPDPLPWPWEIYGVAPARAVRLIPPSSRGGPTPWLFVLVLVIAGLGYGVHWMTTPDPRPSFVEEAGVVDPIDARLAGRDVPVDAIVDAAVHAAVDARKVVAIAAGHRHGPEAGVDEVDPSVPQKIRAVFEGLQRSVSPPCRLELRSTDDRFFVRCLCDGELVEEWSLASRVGQAIETTGLAGARNGINDLCHAR